LVDVRSTKLARRGEASATCRGVVSGPRATVLGGKHVELFLFCTIARVLFYECSPYFQSEERVEVKCGGCGKELERTSSIT
jgi:hypothetical protein